MRRRSSIATRLQPASAAMRRTIFTRRRWASTAAPATAWSPGRRPRSITTKIRRYPLTGAHEQGGMRPVSCRTALPGHSHDLCGVSPDQRRAPGPARHGLRELPRHGSLEGADLRSPEENRFRPDGRSFGPYLPGVSYRPATSRRPRARSASPAIAATTRTRAGTGRSARTATPRRPGPSRSSITPRKPNSR